MEQPEPDNAAALSAVHSALSLPVNLGLAGISFGAGALTGSAARQREFLAGRSCAAQALHLAGCHGDDECLRPVVGPDRLPVWPVGWLGSISHSPLGAVAIAGSSTHSSLLGIDMESWMNAETASEVRTHVALPGELEAIPMSSAPYALTLLFSAKEALYKALFPHARRFFDFHAARLISASHDRLDLELCQPWGRRWPAGHVLSVQYAVTPLHVYTVLHQVSAAH